MKSYEKIRELQELLSKGVISEDEYNTLKSDILNELKSISTPSSEVSQNTVNRKKWGIILTTTLVCFLFGTIYDYFQPEKVVILSKVLTHGFVYGVTGFIGCFIGSEIGKKIGIPMYLIILTISFGISTSVLYHYAGRNIGLAIGDFFFGDEYDAEGGAMDTSSSGTRNTFETSHLIGNSSQENETNEEAIVNETNESLVNQNNTNNIGEIFYIQTWNSVISNNSKILKQNYKTIVWSFEPCGGFMKIKMSVNSEHEFTGHYYINSDSKMEMRKLNGKKYCILEIGKNELKQIFNNGDIWHHQIEKKWQKNTQKEEDPSNQNEVDFSNYGGGEKEELFKTNIKRNPEPRLDVANVFWTKKYTLFDKLTDEPIYPYKKNDLIIYKIYCSTNESLIAEYVELTPEQLENKVAYKFANLENCSRWIESKKGKLKKN
jgi:hypothetical protein